MNLLKSNTAIFTILVFFIIESATDENLSLHRFLPINTEEQPNIKRFQQIMQGGGPTELVNWPQRPKLKTDTIDVKAEIAKLNTSYVYQSSWPATNKNLGSVTAVSFDKDGNVVIFHRADHVWTSKSFDNANIYIEKHLGAIKESTVLALERTNGQLIYEWGKNLFYMPHGLTIDMENNAWVTDVALHQVFKFGPKGSNDKPLMTLGIAFQPGNGQNKFCKPTSVAILKNGDFFVADGYCNARILKYSKNGEKILSWGQNSFSGVSYDVAPKYYFAIPHALTLVPEQELLCAADRENGRVQCFYWLNGTFHSQYHNQIIGDRLFSMDYTPAEGGQFVIVNGPTAELGIKLDHYNEVRGYILNMKSKKVISKFGPNDLQFENPHDVAVTVDGNEIYVAELHPKRIHKFLHKSIAKSMPISASKPNVTTGVGPEYELAPNAQTKNSVNSSGNEKMSMTDDSITGNATSSNTIKPHKPPGATAILVVVLMLLFAFLTFSIALLVARRRKIGCLPFGTKSRHHAWDFPTVSSEGFKLGGLLMDRSKRNGGFEKLEQNASDEETDVITTTTTTTTNLTGTQFA